MTMQALTLVLVFLAVSMLVMGVYALFNRERLTRAESARERLREMKTEKTLRLPILRSFNRSSVPLLDVMLREQPLAAHAELAIERAGLRWSVGEFVIGSALLGVVILLLLQHWGAATAIVGGFIGLTLPWFYIKLRARRRAKVIESQLPDAVDMIVNAMRAGFSFQAAMKFVGDEMPAPLGSEFFRYAEQQRLGADTRLALLDFEERIGTLDAKMFVTSLLIQRETGGNLSEVLTGLANLIRERVALRDHIETLTAEPKASARILGVLPVLMFLTLYLLNRDFVLPLVDTDTGRWTLLYAGISVVAGYLLLHKIADIDL